jgi:hypothetical protein
MDLKTHVERIESLETEIRDWLSAGQDERLADNSTVNIPFKPEATRHIFRGAKLATKSIVELCRLLPHADELSQIYNNRLDSSEGERQ